MDRTSTRRQTRPEPNFGRLVTQGDLEDIVISAHALRRFVERLQPDIPRADRIAEIMATLENIGSGNRSGPEQGQLRDYRNWMTRHVEPHVRDMIRCEGFWATTRPHWSRSRSSSARLLQVGGLCLFPAATYGQEVVLTTCVNGRDITWETALARSYTLIPKPYAHTTPDLLQAPSWITTALEVWRSHHRLIGLLTAIDSARDKTIEQTRLENERRQADATSIRGQWANQCEDANLAFRKRHH
jgi:hypothetical protein